MVKKMGNKYIERITTGSDTNLVNATGAVSKSNPTHPFDDMGKQASLGNSYLEKIALVGLISGAIGSKRGDKIGGTLVGGGVGGLVARRILSLASKAKTLSPMRVAGTIAGSAGGGYLGGKAYSAVKDKVLGTEHRYDGKGNLIKQASLGNSYLEKIAANKHKQYLIDKGQIHSHQFYGPNGSKVQAPTNESIKSIYSSTKPTSTFNTGGRVTTTTPGRGGFLGIGKTPAVTTSIESSATKVTGDTLAGGAKSRLVRKTGVKGILGKAVGLIKRNPLTAAGAALGAGILAGRSGNRDQVQYQYA